MIINVFHFINLEGSIALNITFNIGSDGNASSATDLKASSNPCFHTCFVKTIDDWGRIIKMTFRYHLILIFLLHLAFDDMTAIT